MRTSTMILAAAGSAAAFNAGPSMPIRRIGRVAPSMSLRPGVETSNTRLLDDAEGRVPMVKAKGIAAGILGSAALAVSLALSPVTVGAEMFSSEAILVAEAVDLPAGWESALSEGKKPFLVCMLRWYSMRPAAVMRRPVPDVLVPLHCRRRQGVFLQLKDGAEPVGATSRGEEGGEKGENMGKATPFQATFAAPCVPDGDGADWQAKNRRSGGSSNNLNEIVTFEPPTVPVDRITVKNKVTLEGQCGESDFRSVRLP
jgi:hypothetical protein